MRRAPVRRAGDSMVNPRLRGRRIVLRPLEEPDFRSWRAVRRANAEWLTKWEPRRLAGQPDAVENRDAFATRCAARARERQLSTGFGFGIFVLVASQIIGRPRPDAKKLSTYECGVPPVGTARERFPIKFYLVCMMFILFDVEVVFLFPWAVVFRDLGLYGFLVMFLFLDIVLWGFFYIWKKGVLDWSEEPLLETDSSPE